MSRNIIQVFIIIVATILVVSVEARIGYVAYGSLDYSYNTYDRAVTYSGEALWIDENGNKVLIPVSECPEKCAIDRRCASAKECESNKTIAYIFISLMCVALVYCIWKYACKKYCCHDESE